MTLALDDRQRAMLAQMGIRVFAPVRREAVALEPAAAAPSNAEPQAHAPAATVISRPATSALTRSRPLAPGADTASPVHRTPAGPTGQPDAALLMQSDWEALRQALGACGACAGGRPVFGIGECPADWLIVGDAPDEDEEAAAAPFMGQAGLLLDNMLKALGLERRHNVFLTNIMKCRLPGSRNPTAEELNQCEPVLRRQVQLLQPKVIVVMGRFALSALLGTTEPIGKLRGRAHQYQGVPVVATYHPSYLLRNMPDKAKAWADLCLARELVGAPAGR